MNLAYAASQSSEHSTENIGDVILHHVKDTNILSIRIGETYYSIFSKHVLMMWIAAALVVFVFRFAFRKQHVQNLIPHGIPIWLLPIMIPVEIMGQFTTPFALCIRLFANMTAGHIVILSFISMIFILKSILVSPISVFFALFISLLELFVAFLQAYIFTMLTSLFIGMSIHPQH